MSTIPPLPPSPEDVEAAASSLIWFHSIDLGNGVVSGGVKTEAVLRDEFDRLGLPETLDGLTVLDIGAWDGYFSFEAERRGAARVVALDHYAWALDHHAQHQYWIQCQQEGRAPLPYEEVPGLLDLERLPGRAAFELAHSCRQSRVEAVVGNFTEMDLTSLGTFDVVFFLGVLYHLEDPFRAIRRLRRVTRDRAVIETVCAVFPGMERHPMWQLFPTDELNGDPSNWWAANAAGLVGVCHAAGFQHVDVRFQPGPKDRPAPGYDFHYGRAVVDVRVGAQ